MEKVASATLSRPAPPVTSNGAAQSVPSPIIDANAKTSSVRPGHLPHSNQADR